MASHYLREVGVTFLTRFNLNTSEIVRRRIFIDFDRSIFEYVVKAHSRIRNVNRKSANRIGIFLRKRSDFVNCSVRCNETLFSFR